MFVFVFVFVFVCVCVSECLCFRVSECVCVYIASIAVNKSTCACIGTDMYKCTYACKQVEVEGRWYEHPHQHQHRCH